MTRRQFHALCVVFGACIGFFATFGGWQIVSSVRARSTELVTQAPVPVIEALRLHVDHPAQVIEQLPYTGPTIEPEPTPVTMRRPRPPRRPTVVVAGNNGAPILD